MLQPIHKDNDQICPSCGCVLANTNDYPERVEKPIVSVTYNEMLLGSALEKINSNTFRSSKDVFEEKTLSTLINIVKFYKLPESIAIETFNQMKRNKRGFRSETEPIKQLIKTLSKDDYFFFIKKKNMIKARYENLINR